MSSASVVRPATSNREAVPTKKVHVPDLVLMKERGQRIVMLTAYDATIARLLDRAGVDLLLAGDFLGNVILGLDTTVPVKRYVRL